MFRDRWTNLHNQNLDWIINTVKKAVATVQAVYQHVDENLPVITEEYMDENLSRILGNSLDSFIGNVNASLTNHTEEITALQAQVNALGSGTPTVVGAMADMTDTSKLYVYAGDWYYYDGSSWVVGGTYGQGGVSARGRTILEYILNRVAYTEPGMSTYVTRLINELGGDVTLTSISATFTQGTNVIYYWDDLDYLTTFLVVTATYSDGSTETVASTDYTLSGSLTAGTSTITVTSEGLTNTFNVTVNNGNSYTLTSGELTKLIAGVSSDPQTATNIYVIESTSPGTRRSFVLERGEHCLGYQFVNSTYSPTSSYYPIPIPPDATSVTVAITPSARYVAVQTFTVDDSGYYTRIDDPGWVQGSTTLSFTAGSREYLTVSSKYSSSGSASYTDEPTELTITFS